MDIQLGTLFNKSKILDDFKKILIDEAKKMKKIFLVD